MDKPDEKPAKQVQKTKQLEQAPRLGEQKKYTAKVAQSCYKSGPYYSRALLKRSNKWLKEQSITSRTHSNKQPGPTIYQVYLPPLPLGAQQSLKKKRQQLRNKGFKDASVIRTGVLKNGISLGAFSKEEFAERHVAKLHAKGETSARYRTQQPERKVYWLHVSVVNDKTLRGFNIKFANTAFKKLSCAPGEE